MNCACGGVLGNVHHCEYQCGGTLVAEQQRQDRVKFADLPKICNYQYHCTDPAHRRVNPDERPDHDSLVLRLDQLSSLIADIGTASGASALLKQDAQAILGLIRSQVIR